MGVIKGLSNMGKQVRKKMDLLYVTAITCIWITKI